jgi:hypothetical protein
MSAQPVPTTAHHEHTASPSLDQCISALDKARPGTFNHLLLRLLKRDLERQPDLSWDDRGEAL